jgi:hypothetical protein
LLHGAAKRVRGREHRKEIARGAWPDLIRRRSHPSPTATAVVAAASDVFSVGEERRQSENEARVTVGAGRGGLLFHREARTDVGSDRRLGDYRAK